MYNIIKKMAASRCLRQDYIVALPVHGPNSHIPASAQPSETTHFPCLMVPSSLRDHFIPSSCKEPRQFCRVAAPFF